MKFLEDDRLTQLTAELTDAFVGTGDRVINGRIEAYTMKRAGNDKKYAYALGEKYEHEIQVMENELAQIQKTMVLKYSQHQQNEQKTRSSSSNSSPPPSRRNSGRVPRKIMSGNVQIVRNNTDGIVPTSVGDSSRTNTLKQDQASIEDPLIQSSMIDCDKTTSRRKRSHSVGGTFVPTTKLGGPGSRGILKKSSSTASATSVDDRRGRSASFDIVTARSHRYRLQQMLQSSSSAYSPYSHSPLGDFHNSSTRRLMTDLILTLNASFPDYDFSNVRPSHFLRLPSANIAVHRINEKLSEFAATSKVLQQYPRFIHSLGQHAISTSMSSQTKLGRSGSHVSGSCKGNDPVGFVGKGYLGCLSGGSYSSSTDFFIRLWSAIDDVIQLQESEVYSYAPPSVDDDDDPLEFLRQTLNPSCESSLPLWSFNFFFVNKTRKRIVVFTCVQTMRNDMTSSSLMYDDGKGAFIIEDDDEDDHRTNEDEKLDGGLTNIVLPSFRSHRHLISTPRPKKPFFIRDTIEDLSRDDEDEGGIDDGEHDEDDDESMDDFDLDADCMVQAVSVPILYG